MREVFSSLIGVPGTILIAAGLGVVGVTVVSRLRRRRDPPMRLTHAAVGAVLLAAGVGLMMVDVALIGVR